MIQRLSPLFIRPLLFVGLIFISILPATAASNPIESTFVQGLECLAKQDIDCARIELLKIPPQDTYAKILQGAIAANQNDVDQAFRLLLPIQVSDAINGGSLLPEAIASLHASLAVAYDRQENPLRALEHRIQAEQHWRSVGDAGLEQARQLQSEIWTSLLSLDRNQLVEMRGESLSTEIQGWVDLALNLQSNQNHGDSIANWKSVYPGHPADITLIMQLSPQPEQTGKDGTESAPAEQQQRKIALLLPFASPDFYPAADAIQQGIMAAMDLDGGAGEVSIYPTKGDKDTINIIYAQAIDDGAHFIIGPLARDEVTALVTNALPEGGLKVPTLALNQADASFNLKNLYSLGLSIDTEAAQIARIARDAGIQRAAILMADNSAGRHLAEAFTNAWQSEGGQSLTLPIDETTSSEDGLLSQLQSFSPDIIIMAMGPELARKIRGHLDITIPAFGFSHIYTGINYEPEDASLLAVRFTDLPWILSGSDPAYQTYRSVASNLPEGMMQRWFALGADAYQILAVVAAKPGQEALIHGLTGRIHIGSDGEINRNLAVGRFEGDSVIMEQRP